MVIVAYMGNLHWESHSVAVTLTDPAGGVSNDGGIQTFDQAGNIMAFNCVQRNSISNGNTNAQQMGMVTVTDSAFNNIAIGEFETGFRVQVHKGLGTSGNTVVNFIVVFLIKTRGKGAGQ